MKVRNIAGTALFVPELGREVEAGEVVDVPDARFAGYADQVDTWADESSASELEAWREQYAPTPVDDDLDNPPADPPADAPSGDPAGPDDPPAPPAGDDEQKDDVR